MMRARPSPALTAWLAVSIATHGAALVFSLRSITPAPASPRPPKVVSANLPGETFEVPLADRAPERGVSSGSVADDPGAPSTASEGTSPEMPGAHPETHPRSRPHAATPGTASPAGSGPGEGEKPGTFGAVGERSAVDLASAFTRGFPQAASADPLWVAAPFGSAGSVDVTLTLDETGSLVDTRTSGAPGEALAAGVRRTLALIRAREFVAEGKETRLRVTATVTQDQVHDGLHGEVFAIGGSFEGAGGSGFFALAVGRRIDVRVVVVR
jgi:hypothetical protein